MIRKPNLLLLARIEKFDWIANGGKPFACVPELPCRQAHSWRSACELSAEQIWEDTELEARDELSLYLHNNHRREFQSWNEITDAARELVDGSFALRFRMAVRKRFGEPPKVVVDSMKWDILTAIMEDAYRDLNPPTFFSKLLVLYESGHFPCGWENGIYPAGRLVFF